MALPQKSRTRRHSRAEDDRPEPIQGTTTVILFCYNRPRYLQRALKSLSARLDATPRFRAVGLRVLISQDGRDLSVAEIARTFVSKTVRRGIHAEHLQHPRHPPARGTLTPYYALSQHYEWGLRQAFRQNESRRVIILEDDLELAVDFFRYFEAFAPLLDRDTSLLAVSAWNDHGQREFVSDPQALYRSDFFPGLGWMMPLRIWTELAPKWPSAFWDDWLRENAQRKNRHVIRPEISRTYHFGVHGGASGGLFFDDFLRPIRLNDTFVPFGKRHADSMEQATFDKQFHSAVAVAVPVRTVDEIGLVPRKQAVRIEYQDFVSAAQALGLMDDVRSGVPRGAYRGVVPLKYKGRLLFLTPAASVRL